MKKFVLCSCALLLLASIVFSQAINVPKSKKAFLMKTTATWCDPCGYYHAITDNIYHQHGDSILFINAHQKSSDVGSVYSDQFHSAIDLGATGIPTYNVGGAMLTTWPPSEKVLIDSARKFLKRPIIANVAFKYQVTGTQVAVQTSVKFFAADNADEYYVNVFMLENKIPTKQKSDGVFISLIQDRVLRAPMLSGNAGIWGQKIATGSVSNGAFYDVNFTASLASTWIQSNMQFVAVVWKKKGAIYTALSAEDAPSAGAMEIATINSPYPEASIVYPNPVKSQMNIPVSGAGNITVFNSLGQRIWYTDFKTVSNQVISMNTEELEPGIYFLKMIQDGKLNVQRIIIRK